MLSRNTYSELSCNTLLANRYRITRPLGKGGMGTVYEALDDNVNCIVAIKEMRINVDKSPKACSAEERTVFLNKLRRAFKREAELLSNLDHPVLPKVTDHFFEEDEQFLVMKYISGVNLAELMKIRNRPIPYQEVLPWADKLLDALEHLHKQQIIHRDIKPENIKLTEEGRIYLLDFGLAKGAAGQMLMLMPGQLTASLPMSTAPYAPLEQLNNAGTDEHSDLYSLGATLYHLLTNKIPLTASQRNKPIEMGQPDPLAPVHETNSSVPRLLSDIISMAMAIYRRDRTASATIMREQLRHAAQEDDIPLPAPSGHASEPPPLLLLPASLTVPAQAEANPFVETQVAAAAKFAPVELRTNNERTEYENETLPLSAPSPSSPSLHNVDVEALSSSSATVLTAEETRPHERIAGEQNARKINVSIDAEKLLRGNLDNDESAVTQRWRPTRRQQQQGIAAAIAATFITAIAIVALTTGSNSSGKREDARSLSITPDEVISNVPVVPTNSNHSVDTLSNAAPAVAINEDSSSSSSGNEIKQALHGSLGWKQNLGGQRAVAWSVAYSPDGTTVASASEDKKVRLWDARLWRPKDPLEGHRARVNSVVFSPDGKTVASGSNDKTIRLWDAHSARHLKTLSGHQDAVYFVVFSPDYKMLASVSKDKTIKLWDAQTWQELRTLRGHKDTVWSVAFSSDGKTLASASKDKTIKLWNAQSGEALQTLQGHGGAVVAVAFSPDDKILATGSDDNTIKLWDAETWRALKTLHGHNAYVTSLAFSPDGKTLASGSIDKTVWLWDTHTGKFAQRLVGHRKGVNTVGFSPDGKTLISGSDDETVKMWQTRG